MLGFTTEIDQSESRTQACHVRIEIKHFNVRLNYIFSSGNRLFTLQLQQYIYAEIKLYNYVIILPMFTAGDRL